MAIKQRVLEKLKIIEDNLLYAMKTGNIKTIKAVGQEMEVASRICHEGLTEVNYAPYKDIYDGLKLAIAEMVKDGRNSLNEETMLLCQELLQYLTKETEKETSFKKEVVFLPYQAAMWDSLESVWKAAYEDKEHCNAYVIPIPYCDRNPDRTAKAWHCERDMMPSYVPTLDWSQVDLEEMHPDVIFFHNPYDANNYVTSVDSNYYSSHLKKCTDKLVYIPYYVTEEPQSVDRMEEDARESFILMPGIINADVVVVQSEAVRQIFINVLVRGTNRTDRSYWEKRILALGSPKFDKVLTSKKEDFELPKRWKKLIKDKKVILYNTSVAALLSNREQYVKKHRYVFSVFKKRKDVVLWWRPHPLMEATFESMVPEHAKEYKELCKLYMDEGWGIYDDSPDLHRAICWSDAYYGDQSSVISIYQKTGKPLMLETISSLITMNNWFLATINSYIKDTELYFVPNRTDGVYKLNTQTRELSLIGIPQNKTGEKINGRFAGVAVTKHSIIAYPYNSEFFIKYDKDSENTERKIKCNKIASSLGKNTHRLLYAGESKNKIYLYGAQNFCVLAIDKNTDSSYTLKCMEHVALPKPTQNVETKYTACETDEFMYLLYRYTSFVYKINKQTEQIQYKSLDHTNMKYHLLAAEYGRLWLVNETNNLVEYNYQNMNVEGIWELPSVSYKELLVYQDIYLTSCNICITGIVDQAHTFYILFDKKERKFLGIKKFPLAELVVVIGRQDMDTYWVSGQSTDGEFIAEYNFENAKITPYWLKLDDEQQQTVVNRQSQSDEKIFDLNREWSFPFAEGPITLADFISAIRKRCDENSDNTNLYNKIGGIKIYGLVVSHNILEV